MKIDTMLDEIMGPVDEVRWLLERAREIGINPCSQNAVVAAKRVRARLLDLQAELRTQVHEVEARLAASVAREAAR